MTADVENLMLEILKRLQADMADVRQELAGIRVEISSLGQQIGALTSAVDDLRSIKGFA